STEGGNALALDSTALVYVPGSTQSTGLGTSGAYQSTLSATSQDAFVAQLSASDAPAGWLSYLAASRTDEANRLAVDRIQARVVGSTSATSFPTASPFQSTNAGGTDAFIAKIAQPPPAPVFSSISTDSGPSASDQITNDQTLSISGTAVAGATVTLYRAGVGQL